MSDEALNGATAPAAAEGPQFTVEKIYVKDVSFEVPNAPQVFNDPAQPQLQMNLNQRVQRVGEQGFEVVLGITLTCTVGEKTAYLAEVQQAGIFTIVGFDAQNTDALLGTYAPNTLFPYARQQIADMVQNGGFPPFLIQPINFDQIYAESLRRRQQAVEGQTATTPDVGHA